MLSNKLHHDCHLIRSTNLPFTTMFTWDRSLFTEAIGKTRKQTYSQAIGHQRISKSTKNWSQYENITPSWRHRRHWSDRHVLLLTVSHFIGLYFLNPTRSTFPLALIFNLRAHDGMVQYCSGKNTHWGYPLVSCGYKYPAAICLFNTAYQIWDVGKRQRSRAT